MAETDQTTESSEPQAETSLERGTYEVIRNRLTAGGKRLRERLDKLNTARKEGVWKISRRGADNGNKCTR